MNSKSYVRNNHCDLNEIGTIHARLIVLGSIRSKSIQVEVQAKGLPYVLEVSVAREKALARVRCNVSNREINQMALTAATGEGKACFGYACPEVRRLS